MESGETRNENKKSLTSESNSNLGGCLCEQTDLYWRQMACPTMAAARPNVSSTASTIAANNAALMQIGVPLKVVVVVEEMEERAEKSDFGPIELVAPTWKLAIPSCLSSFQPCCCCCLLFRPNINPPPPSSTAVSSSPASSSPSAGSSSTNTYCEIRSASTVFGNAEEEERRC